LANNIQPTWKLEGNSVAANDLTTLKRPAGLLFLPDDRLVVANRGNNTVLIFKGLSDLVTQNPPPSDYNRRPKWTISHASLADPFALAFDTVTNALYVSVAQSSPFGRILTFNLSSLSAGTSNPTLEPHVIQGSSTGLDAPNGLALDPQN
jgi:DNA-binding beta-propeller fold protein YncE